MQIIAYNKNTHFKDCMRIFESNCPKYFLDDERDEFIRWLNKNTEPYWVIEDFGEIVGCGGIYRAEEHTKSSAEFPNEVGFAWGMVENKYHKQGYGKELSRFRIKYLQKNYPQRPIVLRTSQLTYQFFLKMDFKVIESIKDGWGKGLDKVIMVFKS